MEPARVIDFQSLMRTDFHWTPRQREVLDLLARGQSNQQIADTLHISLDGSKWHMREILSKLNVETREDAAEYWRLYNGWQPRLHRTWRSLAGAGALKLAAAAAGGTAVLFAGFAVALSLTGDGPGAGSPPAEATPTASATPAAPRHIVLATGPQPQPAETTRSLGPLPPSAFPPWNGTSTVIYDIERSAAIDLGPGAQPAAFSPDSSKAVWTAGAEFGQGTEAFLIELATGQRRSLGAGRFVAFADNETVIIDRGANNRWSLNLATGQEIPAPDAEVGPFTTNPGPYPPPTYIIAPPPSGSVGTRLYTVSDRATGVVLLTFDAVAVTPAGPASIAAFSPISNGRSNVWRIDLATGNATFVSTAVPGVSGFPFSATEDAVLWTDGYCPDTGGMVTLFESSSGKLTRLDLDAAGPDSRWATLTPDGNIAVGSFGANVLLAHQTLAVLAVIPAHLAGYDGDISWSPNYKFASHGPFGGHGGTCV